MCIFEKWIFEAQPAALRDELELLHLFHRPVPRGLLRVDERREVGDLAMAISKFCKILQIFSGLVLGCIKTKFCKKICV